VIATAVVVVAGELLPRDDFDESQKTEIPQHTPDDDATGDGWSVELGEWEVLNGNVKEKTDVEAEFSSDYRALLDAGVPDIVVEVTLEIKSGDQLWGTVVRHDSERDWIMAFHDGVGEVVLGKKRPDEVRVGAQVGLLDPTAGGFQELGRITANWSNNQTHTIGLSAIGSDITVFLDGIEVLATVDDDNMSSSMAGIFSRGDGGNKLKSFAINGEDEET
jgi:hypothetical protein